MHKSIFSQPSASVGDDARINFLRRDSIVRIAVSSAAVLLGVRATFSSRDVYALSLADLSQTDASAG